MITIVITEKEEKVKEIIAGLLQQEGYKVVENKEQGNIIKIVKKSDIKDLASIKDTVIELEDSLYNEKKGVLYKSILEVIEKPLIERALERTEGNQLKAARILGINRNTMRVKIRKLGIDPEAYKISA